MYICIYIYVVYVSKNSDEQIWKASIYINLYSLMIVNTRETFSC